MSVTLLQTDQTATEGSSIDDTLDPPDHDANAVDLADDISYMCSQFVKVTGKTAWETAPALTIEAINAKTFLDEKLALKRILSLTDVTVGAADNFKIISAADIPSGYNVKAVGIGTTKGLICATNASFGANSLDEVAGANNLDPKNLMFVIDGTTGDPILSDGRDVYGLLQSETGATDGTAFTDTTPQRAQVSFVRPNATYDDLEACPAADIQGKTVNLAYIDRTDLDSFVEQDFLPNPFADVISSGASVTLDNAIDNQGATPATQATNIFVRIDDDVSWNFATSDGAVNLLKLAPAAAGDEVEVNADTFDVNVGAAGTIDFDNGVTVDSGGTAINLGTTAGQIDSAAALKIDSTGGALTLDGNSGVNIAGNAAEVDITTTGLVDINGDTMQLDATDDANFTVTAVDAALKTLTLKATNTGTGDSQVDISSVNGDITFQTDNETTAIPLDDATAGPISGLFGQSFTSISAAIKYAGETAGIALKDLRIYSLASNTAKDTNMAAATLDLTTYTLDMGNSLPTTHTDTAWVLVFINGRLMRGGASGYGDVYAGTTPASGDLKHRFNKPIKSGVLFISLGFQ